MRRRSGGRPPPIFESWKAAWTRRAASAACASSTTNEMLSSEEPCAIAMTLMRPAARAEKTRAAMPGVPAIPRPTTAITATPRRELTPSTRPARISSRKARSSAATARAASALGQSEADRALRRRLEDGRDRQPLRVHGRERARGHARHPHQALARHRDERLPADRGEGLHRIGRERPPAETSVPGRVRVEERANEQGDAAAVEGDEGARVQDLGPEVRDLGRLAVVQLREKARVGDGSRIGGEDAGHVLPEHDARGAERAARGASR